MLIIKRNEQLVDFEKSKISTAILKAMKYGSGIVKPEIAEDIAETIRYMFEDGAKSPTVQQVESIVYHELVSRGQVETAKAYEGYRAVQAFKRNNNTTDDGILQLVSRVNKDVMEENSNKNAVLNSTQRDLIAGEVSKDIARRKIIPAHLVQAHDNGILHWHDMDYTLSPMFNCFNGDTKFVTDKGIFSFKECGENSVVNVLDKDGKWRSATVRKYGKQKINKVILKSCRTQKEIMVTDNHRWLLKDGSITTNLKIGDRLHLLNSIQEEKDIDLEMFCFGFILGDGVEYSYSDTNKGLRIRLCGDKVRHIDKFKEVGYTISTYSNNKNKDIWLTKATSLSKKDFINNKGWRNLNHIQLYSLFKGYYEADGFKDRNGIATSSSIMAEMIREISCVCGYHITSEKFEIRDTNYKENAELYTFRFMTKQSTNRNWIVKEIIELDNLVDVWCVEEPITKTFTLNGGVVTGNCCLVNLGDMLDNGTVINEKLVESPKSFQVACTVTTQIIAQVASNQYGGQSIDIKCLGKYLKRTFDKAYKSALKKQLERTSDMNQARKWAYEDAVEARQKDLSAGIQTMQYQINTLMTTNGQAPFVTLFLNLEEGHEYEEEIALIIQEILKQRLQGIKNEAGVYVTPSFPKLIYVLHEHNNLSGGKYDYITKLASKCSAKRLYPDYISAKKMKEIYNGNVFSCMGCRSFLSPWVDADGNYKFEGRFNMGVVSLNLPQMGILAKGDMDKFWSIFEERLSLCKEALLFRYESLKGTISDVSPIHWQHGAIARLKKGETIDKLLENGYATISLGYIGLYELTKLMTGESHTSKKGSEFAKAVMDNLKKATQTWKEETGLGFGLYGTPAESLCYRFARIDKTQFGDIKDITDKGYYTNSYHVDVREEIDAFSKLEFESQFQPISSGGCISYIEIPNMNHNLEALEEIIKFIYDHIQYAEFNTKSDYCLECGFDGEIKINDDLEWECPQCGNKDKSKMSVTRRTCGYLGSNYWNKGKTKEIQSRVLHL